MSEDDYNKSSKGIKSIFPASTTNLFTTSGGTKKKTVANPPQTLQENIILKPNEKTSMIMQFMYYPEYMNVGDKITINDGALKACGEVTYLFEDV